MSSWKLFAVSLLISAGILASTSILAEEVKSEPLVIQEQGSFAVGGTVATEPGTFDPVKPLNPAGQTYHGDHLYQPVDEVGVT